MLHKCLIKLEKKTSTEEAESEAWEEIDRADIEQAEEDKIEDDLQHELRGTRTGG
jgi:hypothetical protein